MSDTTIGIHCPACGKRMNKIYLSNQQIFIDICSDGCGGIWLDNRELQKIDEKHENIDEIKEELKGKVFEPVDNSKERICPICNQKMVKNYVSAKLEVQVDECYHCGGKFFDSSELKRMRDEYENDAERTADVMKLLDMYDEILG